MMRGLWTHEVNSIACLDFPREAAVLRFGVGRAGRLKLEAASGFEPLHRGQKTENKK